MQSYPKVIEIFDRKRVRSKRNRASAKFSENDFLFQWAADQLKDRLADVKRTFPLALQIGARCSFGDMPSINHLVVTDIAENYLPDNNPAVQSDEETLPFAQNSFDLVINALGLHTINDLPGALIQINRSLKPDGLFIGAMLGGETLYQLRTSLSQAEIKLRGGMGPRISPFADMQQMSALMQRGRFALPVVDSEIVTVTYDNMTRLLHDIRNMGEASVLTDGNKVPLTRSVLKEAEKIYREKFSDDEGKLMASYEVIFLIGWAPHESQQKPLRPGSAEHRLSEALNTNEISTGVKTTE